MAIVWIADTAAYFAGRAFGRRKLAPQISPARPGRVSTARLAAVAVYALALVPLARCGWLLRHGVAGRRRRLGRMRARARRAVGRGRPLRVAAEASGRRRRTAGAFCRDMAAFSIASTRCWPRCRRRRCSRTRLSAMIRRNDKRARRDRIDRRLDARRHRVAIRTDLASPRSTAHSPVGKLARLCLRPSAAMSQRCPIPPQRRWLERALAAPGLPTRVLAARPGSSKLRRFRTPTPSSRRSSAPRACARRLPPLPPASAFCSRTRRRSSSAARRSWQVVADGRRDAAADRQRAQRDLPMSAARATRAIRRLRACAASSLPRRADRSARDRSRNSRRLRADEACAHPNWVMGPQDQRRLGDHDEQGSRDDRGALAVRRAARAIEIVIHPESVIHSLVEYVDGSVLAAARPSRHANADRAGARRTPIASIRALLRSTVVAAARSRSRRPIARASRASTCVATRSGEAGSAPAVLNAANEVAAAAVPRRPDSFHGYRAGVRRNASTRLPARR